MGREDPAPSESREVARKGESTITKKQALGEGQGAMLKGDQERIRRRDSSGGGEKRRLSWDQVKWRYYKRV